MDKYQQPAFLDPPRPGELGSPKSNQFFGDVLLLAWARFRGTGKLVFWCSINQAFTLYTPFRKLRKRFYTNLGRENGGKNPKALFDAHLDRVVDQVIHCWFNLRCMVWYGMVWFGMAWYGVWFLGWSRLPHYNQKTSKSTSCHLVLRKSKIEKKKKNAFFVLKKIKLHVEHGIHGIHGTL